MQVVWTGTALDDLARLWVAADASLRALITAATHKIDQALAHDPQAKGESREFDERILFAEPLGILFKINAAKKVVFVHAVWRYQLRTK
jgi:hypothetical protein